jgi:hypothetical protein
MVRGRVHFLSSWALGFIIRKDVREVDWNTRRWVSLSMLDACQGFTPSRQGLTRSRQGLTPLAIDCRPFGAFS